MLVSASKAAQRGFPQALARCSVASTCLAARLAAAAEQSTAEPGFFHISCQPLHTYTQPRSLSRGFAAEAARAQTSDDEAQQPEQFSKPSLDGHAHQSGQRSSHKSHPDADADAELLDRNIAESRKDTYWLMQPVYKPEYVERVEPRHKPAKGIVDRSALGAISMTRWVFDKATGYGPNMTEAKWLRRIIFLETVAGVPGMVAGMLRHMRSLRRMQRDHGWIHTLLEEAENERMHLLTFMTLRQPGPFFRAMVLLAQGVYFNIYFLTYLISPRYCHTLVGYLEEEAVRTYTHAIQDLDEGKLPDWENKAAPEVAIRYWKLPEDAKMRELLLAVRADEAGHSYVNHKLSELKPDQDNPFAPGSHEVP